MERQVANQYTQFYATPTAKNPTPVVVTIPLSWLQMLHWVADLYARRTRSPRLCWLQARWQAVADLLGDELRRALAEAD